LLLDAEKQPGMRAVALTFLGGLTWRQGSFAAAQDLYDEALPLFEQANEPWVLASALTGLAYIALSRTDYRVAQARLEKALPAWRDSGDQANVAIYLSNLGYLALQQEDYDVARARSEESVRLGRAAGDEWALSLALGGLGHALFGQGDIAAARPVLEESVLLGRQFGGHRLAYNLDGLGRVATAEGDYAAAHSALRESLQILHEIGDEAGIAQPIESIAALAAAEAQAECAVQLAAAAASIREARGVEPAPIDRARVDHWLAPVRHALGPKVSARAWETGHVLSLERAIQMALATTQPTPRRRRLPIAPVPNVSVLSQREQQVAALLAQNLSNRQIAGQLVITQRTVATHIEHILDKLGFASRHQIGAWAAERDLFI
jgi:ATP/maltotriose-dependent transcriptional regulator MalT